MTGSPLFVIITSKIEICCRFIWVSAHARVDPAPWPRNWVIQRRRDLFFTCLFSQTRQEVCLYRVWRCCSGFQNATICARVSETESESITIPSETLSTFRSRSSIEKTCNKITITLNEYHCHIILNLTALKIMPIKLYRYGSLCDRVALFCVWCVHCVCVWHLLLQFFWIQYFTHLVCLTCLRCYTIRKDNKQFHVLYVHDWGCLEKNMPCVWRV